MSKIKFPIVQGNNKVKFMINHCLIFFAFMVLIRLIDCSSKIIIFFKIIKLSAT